ncbi:hypothetical protein IEO21_01079 [Rhodonia placenta]|uniref:Uncharacterized protein n=1 Tax=Rhodonia placenta TaxID=104341 RepID=A0A8H7PAF7_9APHY|nr:hypothetical protein IEO21_01079 [Postia placenta]
MWVIPNAIGLEVGKSSPERRAETIQTDVTPMKARSVAGRATKQYFVAANVHMPFRERIYGLLENRFHRLLAMLRQPGAGISISTGKRGAGGGGGGSDKIPVEDVREENRDPEAVASVVVRQKLIQSRSGSF